MKKIFLALDIKAYYDDDDDEVIWAFAELSNILFLGWIDIQ